MLTDNGRQVMAKAHIEQKRQRGHIHKSEAQWADPVSDQSKTRIVYGSHVC